MFLQLVDLRDSRRTQGSDGAHRGQALQRGQTWVMFHRRGGSDWSLQLGRAALVDHRDRALSAELGVALNF